MREPKIFSSTTSLWCSARTRYGLYRFSSALNPGTSVSTSPTGAKGLNLAASDAHYLAISLREYYDEKSTAGIDNYSNQALARVWKAVRFSWWMSSMLHKFPDTGSIGARIQLAELDYVCSSGRR